MLKLKKRLNPFACNAHFFKNLYVYRTALFDDNGRFRNDEHFVYTVFSRCFAVTKWHKVNRKPYGIHSFRSLLKVKLQKQNGFMSFDILDAFSIMSGRQKVNLSMEKMKNICKRLSCRNDGMSVMTTIWYQHSTPFSMNTRGCRWMNRVCIFFLVANIQFHVYFYTETSTAFTLGLSHMWCDVRDMQAKKNSIEIALTAPKRRGMKRCKIQIDSKRLESYLN